MARELIAYIETADVPSLAIFTNLELLELHCTEDRGQDQVDLIPRDLRLQSITTPALENRSYARQALPWSMLNYTSVRSFGDMMAILDFSQNRGLKELELIVCVDPLRRGWGDSLASPLSRIITEHKYLTSLVINWNIVSFDLLNVASLFKAWYDPEELLGRELLRILDDLPDVSIITLHQNYSFSAAPQSGPMIRFFSLLRRYPTSEPTQRAYNQRGRFLTLCPCHGSIITHGSSPELRALCQQLAPFTSACTTISSSLPPGSATSRRSHCSTLDIVTHGLSLKPLRGDTTFSKGSSANDHGHTC
ncbi:uncharacterized protein B0H18DRAFT_1101052 [Fomitopsis serialis]|uniref:uncharacterized protein n=1 Tax=Fomitopsis serialis TaxID=139415 RepID=UPI0020086EC8|nr:uncharacterized protein B0H18DRAFT_1101052 [Neoantrodia serialis]KAH9936558.1 hypothetical protein B0H18DRAFT_1101052 [Neoantrodia serialis]